MSMVKMAARFSLVLAAFGAPHAARAQGASVTIPRSPAVIHTTNTVTIGGNFSVTPGSVVQNGFQANPCNPGACFDAALTVRANSRWLLQVTLNETPANFTVTWVESRSPILIHPLSAGVYQTIASGTAATSGAVLSTMYNANKTSGKNGAVPTASQLAAVLSYRVIAAP